MASEEGFEKSLARLEELVAKLESGELPLEESMKQFEEGMVLSGRLAERLEQARRKVEALTRGREGKPALEPFPDPAMDSPADAEGDGEGDEPAKPARKGAKKAKPQDSLF